MFRGGDEMPQHIPKEVDAVHDIGSQGVVITRRQIDGYLAVSYTHLDVYKRQVYHAPPTDVPAPSASQA